MDVIELQSIGDDDRRRSSSHELDPAPEPQG